MAPPTDGSIGITLQTGDLASFKLHVELDPRALAELLRGPNGAVARAMLQRGQRVKRGAQNRVGVDTGRLRDSIVARMGIFDGEVGVSVGSVVPYAWWHHEGSAAVSGKLMAFKPKGSSVTIFRTKRRAIPPNRFLVNSIHD